jgi:hypothetical protein
MSWTKSRWFAWWYATIAVGFVLLAIRSALLGERPFLIALRLVIAAGFAVLAWLQFQGKLR